MAQVCKNVIFRIEVGIPTILGLTLLGLQSRFGDNLGQTTWNLTGVSPKRDWSSKRVKKPHIIQDFFFQRKRATSVAEPVSPPERRLLY